MSYSIAYQPKALLEYEEAVKWYRKRSIKAAEEYTAAVDEKTNVLRNAPTRYRKTYKDFHKVALDRYPYILIYLIDEEKKEVIIFSIFHKKRNPEEKFEEE